MHSTFVQHIIRERGYDHHWLELTERLVRNASPATVTTIGRGRRASRLLPHALAVSAHIRQAGLEPPVPPQCSPRVRATWLRASSSPARSTSTSARSASSK